MSDTSFFSMNGAVRSHIDQIIGQTCCRQHVASDGSLFLGFGGIETVKNPRGEAEHGKWEIGTYYRSWRVVVRGSIVCGGQDAKETLRERLSQIRLKRCIGLRHLTRFDVRVEFEDEISVDVLGALGDGDQLLHIFCPDGFVVTFTCTEGWAITRASAPG